MLKTVIVVVLMGALGFVILERDSDVLVKSNRTLSFETVHS